MLKKQKPKIGDLVPKVEVSQTFEGADAKEAEHKELKEIIASKNGEKKAGRPMEGKSKTKHKVAFYVNDEQLEYLESLTNRKERTPNAVAKKMIVSHIELHIK
jgi:hypothetical protein